MLIYELTDNASAAMIMSRKKPFMKICPFLYSYSFRRLLSCNLTDCLLAFIVFPPLLEHVALLRLLL